MVDAIGVAWLIAVFGPNLTFLQWLQCYLVLAAYGLALTALTARTAAWVAVLCGVAWLTCGRFGPPRSSTSPSPAGSRRRTR